MLIHSNPYQNPNLAVNKTLKPNKNPNKLSRYTKYAKQYMNYNILKYKWYCIMSERQLPADRRSRIQQGFAASLLLTPLLFFWIFWLQMRAWRGTLK